MTALALEVSSVSKRWGDRTALDQVHLSARPGELHGLLGPNGAGKTTLLRILLGLVGRDGGTVRLLGCELSSTTGVPRGVAGFVDTPAFYPYLSGRQNLSLLARLDDDRRAGSNERIASVIEEVGLSAQADVAVRGYSAGMRQRLGIASSLLRTPRLLFLDEPTSSLDPGAARDACALTRRIADQGAAVVFSSHDMSEVEALCTTLTVINGGRVVFSGSTDDLRQRAPSTIYSLRTSDDDAAFEVARGRPGLCVGPAPEAGLELTADVVALDAYVIALGNAGVAVRSLTHRTRSLESLFLELTRSPDTSAVPVAASSDLRRVARAPVVAS